MIITLIDPHLFIVIVLAECVCTDVRVLIFRNMFCVRTLLPRITVAPLGQMLPYLVSRHEQMIAKLYITLALLSSDSTITRRMRSKVNKMDGLAMPP